MKTRFQTFTIVAMILIGIFSMTINPVFSINDPCVNRSQPRSNGVDAWGPIHVISEPSFGQDINVGVSGFSTMAVENGNVYIVWDDENNTNGAGSTSDIFYRHFDGSIWSETQVISEPVAGQDFSSLASVYPRIAVENDKVYVVWASLNNTNNAGSEGEIFYRCNLTGTGWEDIQVISEPVEGQNFNSAESSFPDIAVENGNIYTVWEDENNTDNAGTDKDIFIRTNTTGTGWGPIDVLSEPIVGGGIDNNIGDSYQPRIDVENNNLYVAWSDYNNTDNSGTDGDVFYRQYLTGSGWEPIQILSEPVPGQDLNIGVSGSPSIAVENSKLYVAWIDSNNTHNSGFDYDIFYRCNLTGTRWETVQVISEPVPGQNFNNQLSIISEIAVEGGNIYTIWIDHNNTNGADTDTDTFFKSNCSGIGWDPVQVVSEPVFGQDFNTGGMGTGTVIRTDVEVENGVIHTTWIDGNQTNGAGWDADVIYRKYAKLSLTGPSVMPSSGNTSTLFNFTVTYVHYNDIAPTKIVLNLSGVEYALLESDPGDTNYVDGKDYYFNINHLIIGTHSYRFFASDGAADAFSAVVALPVVYNTIPEIITQDNLTAYEEQFYETDYEYDDIDLANVGQLGTWNFSTNAGWLNFDLAMAILSGTPTNNDIGMYWVNISINDTMEIDFTNFTLTVVNINDDPVINTTNIEITYEDELYSVDYNATDIDSDIGSQIWALTTNASVWLDIDTGTGSVSGIPTNDDVGKYWVNISVDDSDLGLAFTNFSLIVLNVNDCPIITTENVLEAPVNILYIVDYNATDIDSPLSQLTWSLDGNAWTWLSINSVTGVLSGTPAETDIGDYDVNVTVNDGDDGFDWHKFDLTVTPSEIPDPDNYPPVITTTDKVSITAGGSYNNVYEATDDRTPVDYLVWSLNSNASWLSFNMISRSLSGNPTQSDVGWYWVNVTVFDGEGGFDSHNFTLAVWATANGPPDILTEDDINAIVGELYSVDYEAEDDRTPINNLQWSLETNTSDWLSIDPKTGVLNGTPELDDVGSYWVKISVFDGEDGWDFSNFTLYVTTEPITSFKPELSNPTMTPASGDTNTEFTFTVDYSHPEGDLPESIQVVIDDVGYDMTLSNGHYEYTTKLSEGNHTYYFITILGEFTVDTDTFNMDYITKAEGQPEDGDDDGEDDNTMLFALIGIIVVIIIVLILVFLFVIRKKKPEEEPMVEQPQVPEERVVPEELAAEQPPMPEFAPDQPPPPEVAPPQPVPQVAPTPPQTVPQPTVTPQILPTVTEPPVTEEPATDEELEE